MIGMILCSIFFLLLGMIAFHIPYHVHKCMVIDDCDTYGYGTYKRFLIEYKKGKWERTCTHEESHFGVGDEYSRYQIHASIIKFNGHGMIMKSLFQYLRFKLWERKHSIKRDPNRRIDWDNNDDTEGGL